MARVDAQSCGRHLDLRPADPARQYGLRTSVTSDEQVFHRSRLLQGPDAVETSSALFVARAVGPATVSQDVNAIPNRAKIALARNPVDGIDRLAGYKLDSVGQILRLDKLLHVLDVSLAQTRQRNRAKATVLLVKPDGTVANLNQASLNTVLAGVVGPLAHGQLGV